ncbi:MAG: phosphatidate cytidylyltransferase, partial [Pseudomonadota bacterium]|nr:phosphatidate cytidylyltransferase [Pseudomonadota bacterium]
TFIVSLGLAFFIRHSKLEHWRWLIYLDVLFWIFLAPIWIARGVLLRRWVKACIGITLLLPFSVSLVLLRDLSPWILLRYMAVFWVSDTFAYFSGRIFGHHKLAPQTSPGKTWEGVAGGMIAVTIYAIIVTPQFLMNFQFYGMLAMAVIGIIGDLFESMIKRQAGVKDSGRLLPGHGGILDRLDSQIAALPLALLLIR